MQRLNILFLSSWYPTKESPTNGNFVKRHAEAISLYHNVSVIHVCSDENISEIKLEESDDDGIYTIIAYYPKVKSDIAFISQYLKYKRYLKAFEIAYEKLKNKIGTPDLAHLNVIFPAGIIALHLKSKYNIPFITTEHWTGYMPSDNSYHGVSLKQITSKVISESSHITPVSEQLKESMIIHGLNGRYSVIPNVVDIATFNILPAVTKKTDSFLHISTLDERQKNISGILHSFYAAWKENSNIKLNIIGNGENKKKAEALSKELGILNQSVFFLGLKNSTEIIQHLNEARALLMFSNYETFSCVIAEAWSCGTPVIASMSGGIENKITKENGILISPKNEKALKNAILKMANPNLNFNREEIRKFAVENFSYDSVGKKISDIYASIISNNNISS